jgi:hypothetical protein
MAAASWAGDSAGQRTTDPILPYPPIIPEANVTATAQPLRTSLDPTRPAIPTLPSLAAASAALSAAILTAAFGFLAVAHVAGGMRFGDGHHSPIVDAFDALAILLLVPVPFALHARLGRQRPNASAAAVALSVDALVFGAILHGAFALGLLRFDAVGPLLVIGYAAFAAWLWLVGSIGADSGLLPNGRRMAVVAATIVGMPVWLIWVARRLAA